MLVSISFHFCLNNLVHTFRNCPFLPGIVVSQPLAEKSHLTSHFTMAGASLMNANPLAFYKNLLNKLKKIDLIKNSKTTQRIVNNVNGLVYWTNTVIQDVSIHFAALLTYSRARVDLVTSQRELTI